MAIKSDVCRCLPNWCLLRVPRCRNWLFTALSSDKNDASIPCDAWVLLPGTDRIICERVYFDTATIAQQLLGDDT